ncbi:hypothetical protein IL54_1627 [Sphingobium sp. ba1]|nr:hypothetical protein IL54_1627 [Sphingobium sp. ba1]
MVIALAEAMRDIGLIISGTFM